MQERNFTPAGMELNSKLRAGAKIRGAVVDVAERAADDFDFAERLTELNEELERLNAEARMLEIAVGFISSGDLFQDF